MIQIIIPAAGEGSRFKEAGYEKPKPLIDLFGKPMISRVVENLMPRGIKSRAFIIHKLADYSFADAPFISDVLLRKPTQGAVETILKAEKYIDMRQSLLIGNCDQLVAFDSLKYVRASAGYDGSLVTFKSNKPHHSYVEKQDGVICRIVEKEVISNEAVTGIYFFQQAADFFFYANMVVERDTKVKGEFYVSSVLDLMIKDGYRLTTYDAPSAMLGTPEEMQLFEAAVQVGKTL